MHTVGSETQNIQMRHRTAKRRISVGFVGRVSGVAGDWLVDVAAKTIEPEDVETKRDHSMKRRGFKEGVS